MDGLPAASAALVTASATLETGAPPQVGKRVGAAAASENAALDAPEQAPRPRSDDGAGAPSTRQDKATDAATATESTGTTDAAAASTVATPTATSHAVSFPTAAITTTASTGTPPPLPEAPGGAGAIGGAVFALLLVVGLILALAWLAKRMPGVAGSTNAALRVVGSLSLGPRERVVVVAVGDTQLLLSVGAGGTRTLHTLETPLAMTDAAPSAFATLLSQQFGKKA